MRQRDQVPQLFLTVYAGLPGYLIADIQALNPLLDFLIIGKLASDINSRKR